MTTATATRKTTYTIIDTYRSINHRQAALAFGACLAADKGVSNRIINRRGETIVVADDNRAIRFTR